jgi:hypothetical protein
LFVLLEVLDAIFGKEGFLAKVQSRFGKDGDDFGKAEGTRLCRCRIGLLENVGFIPLCLRLASCACREIIT